MRTSFSEFSVAVIMLLYYYVYTFKYIFTHYFKIENSR